MSDVQIAWLVIGGAGLAGVVCLWRLLKNTRWGLLPWLAITVSLAFFVVPVPVPNHPEQLAPAFVVAIFEMFFQIDGQPQASLRVLGLTLSMTALLTVIVYYFAQGRRREKPAKDKPPHKPEAKPEVSPKA